MWQLIAIVLAAVLLFYWLAFMGTIWMWANAIFSLCKLHFIRASLWFNAGVFMLFWWFDKPHDWDTMMPGVSFLYELRCTWNGCSVLLEAKGDAGHTDDAGVDTTIRGNRKYRPGHRGEIHAVTELN